MCGIAGSVNFPLPVREVLSQLRHRGPDEQCEWTQGPVQFLHTRLAVQDLTPGGRQPMHLHGLHILFNGEIYNHHELRIRYAIEGKSESDTETLLHLFHRKGIDMLDDLDGMFAMAIYDESSNQLWLCRDRAGEKPLYYSHANQRFVFASELGVLAKVLRPEIDRTKLANFLCTGYFPIPETPFIGVSELEPGSYIRFDLSTQKFQQKKWWSIEPFYLSKSGMSKAMAMEQTEHLLHQSIKRRMLSSDLEVGTFLSGGIDSGLVTAIASEYTSRLKSFTVSFDGMYNEAPLAAKAATLLGTDHHEIKINLDHLETDLEKIFALYGEPIMDDSIVPSYYVAKHAKRDLTVVLNGDAGDELFGGYRRYVSTALFDPFANRRGRQLVKAMRSLLPRASSKMSPLNYVHRILDLLSSDSRHAYFRATNDMLHPDLSSLTMSSNLQPLEDSLHRIQRLDVSALRRMMLLDFHILLPAILLVKMDIASMANSLETRSPFLSKEILEFAPTIPDQLKVNNFRTKYILRKLARKYLPAEYVTQPKRGFEVPIVEWMNGRLKPMVRDYLNGSNAFIKELVHKDAVDQMLDNQIPAIAPDRRAKILFAFLSVECWKRSLSNAG